MPGYLPANTPQYEQLLAQLLPTLPTYTAYLRRRHTCPPAYPRETVNDQKHVLGGDTPLSFAGQEYAIEVRAHAHTHARTLARMHTCTYQRACICFSPALSTLFRLPPRTYAALATPQQPHFPFHRLIQVPVLWCTRPLLSVLISFPDVFPPISCT
eukprot:5339336-Pleurochrysis_carterae.AAC.2